MSGYIESAMSGTTYRITCSTWGTERIGYVDINLTSDSDAGETEDNTPKDTTPPTITFSELPKAGTVSRSEPVKITVYTDEPAFIYFNGQTSDDFVTEYTFEVTYNCQFTVSARDKSNNFGKKDIVIDFFQKPSSGTTLKDYLDSITEGGVVEEN